MAPDIDTTRMPMLIVRLHGPATDDEHAAYLVQLAGLAKRGPHAVIIEALGGGALSPAQRRAQAAWLREHETMLRENCLGNAFVFPSAVQRFMLSGIMLLARLPMPHGVFGTFEEAERWARERLAPHFPAHSVGEDSP